MGAQHHGLAALGPKVFDFMCSRLVEAVLDGGQRRVDPLRVRDDAGVLKEGRLRPPRAFQKRLKGIQRGSKGLLLVLGHIEVHADEDPLPGHIHGIDSGPELRNCEPSNPETDIIEEHEAHNSHMHVRKRGRLSLLSAILRAREMNLNGLSQKTECRTSC